MLLAAAADNITIDLLDAVFLSVAVLIINNKKIKHFKDVLGVSARDCECTPSIILCR